MLESPPRPSSGGRNAVRRTSECFLLAISLCMAATLAGCRPSSAAAPAAATCLRRGDTAGDTRVAENTADLPSSGLTTRARALLADGPLHGVVLGLFSQDPEYDYRELLTEIRATGTRWVSLCINHYQRHNDSVEIDIPDPRSAPLSRVRSTAREAHELGLRVMVFPVLLLTEPGPDHWRGTLAPKDTDTWYRNYCGLLEGYATLAEEEGVEILSVGSEFNSLEGDGDRWRALIARLRARYSGALTYSANWDSLDGPGFYDVLDIIGMTTYFSLTDKDDPTVAELEAAWRPIREDILTWQAHVGIPLMFTEVGFSSQDGINKDPWNYFISKRVDLEEQRDCFRAFTSSWQTVPQLSGVFFYNWFGKGGPEDTGYTPRGKPALEVLKEWFPAPPDPADDRGAEEP